MNSLINKVESSLFKESDLSVDKLQDALSAIHSFQLDYSDIFLQNKQMEFWQLEDGIVKDSSFNINKGIGVRTIEGSKTGFAYANEFTLKALDNAVSAATSISRQGQHGSVNLQSLKQHDLYSSEQTLAGVSQLDKISLLRKIDHCAREQEQSIEQVIVSLAASDEKMMVCATDGTLASDIRPMMRLSVTVLIQRNGLRERGSAGLGGRILWAELLELDFKKLVSQAIKQANVNLEAQAAPAGVMPVILGNGWPGVLLHEAIGHGLEGDFNRKGSSAYSNLIGQKVASEHCTIIDDGSISGKRGSLNVDDEGTPTQSNVLIEKGILKGYMQDKHNARLMGQQATGNGRRESYSHLPLPRMTNTFMLSGKHLPEEIISSVKKGIYAPNFAGGQVDITSGNFVFSASEAYLIEDGKVTAPIKGATLIGNGPEVLKKVSMVGNDSQLDPGIGVCGKDGQSVAVCVGQPTLKIDELTVGGTQ